MNLLNTSNVDESSDFNVPPTSFDAVKPVTDICQLNTGKVYTPTFLANWVAKSVLDYVEGDNIVAIDPACGDGELLSAMRNQSQKEIYCIGMDIDKEAVSRAKDNLGVCSEFHEMNSLLQSREKPYQQEWRKLNGKKPIDVLIANPPWGSDLSHVRDDLINAGYQLAKGQFDAWDLFVELSLSQVKPGGHIAFIIPDSIFLPEHEDLRRLLCKKTSILLIARLGEGFFKSVFRGTTVVILQNKPASPKHRTEVLRLDSKARKLILKNESSLEDARKKLSHRISQKRFSADNHCSWDIDFREKEHDRFQEIFSSHKDWASFLETGRGVELSKYGKVIQCKKCSQVTPKPRIPRFIECSGCGVKYHSSQAEVISITTNEVDEKEEWVNFLVGEDVGRYDASPSRLLKREVQGINYKDESVYSTERLLIRKTGLGINAAIVDEEAYTNQVVFHYYVKDTKKVPSFYLSYILGVLNSRTLFAYHLRKNGENEWRSHPYVTQKVLSRFPIPSIGMDGFPIDQAKAIARKVNSIRKSKNRTKLELELECLVAGLFNLNEDDVRWVKHVICSAQELAPMKEMKNFDFDKVKAVYV